MGRVMIVEDNPTDIRNATTVLKKVGVPDADVETVRSVASAIVRLQDAVDGLQTPPYLLVLDLDFPNESGFEVLRLWRSNPKLKNATRIVVWTSMGDRQVEISRLFGVDVVRKSGGTKELDESLRRFLPVAGQNLGAI